jgi:uncharacterized membrane protein YbjE (DUF340 family)
MFMQHQVVAVHTMIKTDTYFPYKYTNILFLMYSTVLIFVFDDQVSYCHHLVSVVIVRHKLFQKSSPLKVLDQWKPNLVWIITRVSSFKIVSGDAVHQPLLLKIEHMVKLQVLGNNSKTVNNIKNDQHSKIYLPCNFKLWGR